jgi:hypothetical protein
MEESGQLHDLTALDTGGTAIVTLSLKGGKSLKPYGYLEER